MFMCLNEELPLLDMRQFAFERLQVLAVWHRPNPYWSRSLGGRSREPRQEAIYGVLDPLPVSKQSVLRNSERSNFWLVFCSPSAAQTPREARNKRHTL